MEKTKNYDVYIIYRRKDRNAARVIAQLLQSAGKSVFFDMELLLTGDFSKQISSGLESSQSYIVLLSEGCADRSIRPEDWWTKEIEHAVQSGKKIIPVNIENSFKSDGLKDLPEALMSLLKIQWMPFYGNQSDRFVNNILSLLDNQVSNEHKKENHDIFLAYPREDNKAGDKLTKIIQSNGFSVWRDNTGIMAGELYADGIINAISNSKVFIALYSSWALDSMWFKKEFEFAQKKNIPIIKVLTDTPEGLSETRRMTFGTVLEMGCTRFDEKLLSTIINNGCKSDTKEMYAYGKELYDRAHKTRNLRNEKRAFGILMRAAELGDCDAQLCIERQPWDIDLGIAASEYVPINSYFVEDMRADLYNRGVIIAEDPTLDDSPVRGEGMERASFEMMKRAIDLGHSAESPLDYPWYFLKEKDFDICLDSLGKSSRIHLVETKQTKPIVKNKEEKRKAISQMTSELEEISPDADYCIFISYKRVDEKIVFPIKDIIENKTGKKCWIDLDGIESDAQFANVIIKAINNAQVFLFMYSHSHAEIEDYDTDWTVREINFAQKKKKRIVFINIDGSPLTDWFELMFGTKQQINASSKVLMEKLCKDLTKWLK